MFALAAAVVLAVAPPSLEAGRRSYETYCASCHAGDLRGGVDGPTIRGVGAADVDFMLQTGRMPAAVPWIEEGHRNPQLPPATIDAIVAYVTSVEPGGPPIPLVSTRGDAQRGRNLYQQNCEHCHGVYAQGASIGGNEWAPSLHETSITQVAEAIRVGPGEMPRFGERQLPQADLDDVAAYVSQLDAKTLPSGVPIASSGPVPEGLLGWLAAGALALFAYAFAKVR